VGATVADPLARESCRENYWKEPKLKLLTGGSVNRKRRLFAGLVIVIGRANMICSKGEIKERILYCVCSFWQKNEILLPIIGAPE
jgi:hypothetical protein